jgi:hypothetical protein
MGKYVITNCDDIQFKDVYEAINYLLQKDKDEVEHRQRRRIGFIQSNKKKTLIETYENTNHQPMLCNYSNSTSPKPHKLKSTNTYGNLLLPRSIVIRPMRLWRCIQKMRCAQPAMAKQFGIGMSIKKSQTEGDQEDIKAKRKTHTYITIY